MATADDKVGMSFFQLLQRFNQMFIFETAFLPQSGIGDRKSVRSSVCLSVCQTRKFSNQIKYICNTKIRM